MRFERRPHPNSADHEVVAFRTRVYHELCVPRGLSDEDVLKEIAKYLRGYVTEAGEKVKGYEDHYPETRVVG